MLCADCGKILQSQISKFRRGNTIYDYAHPRYHYQIRIILSNIHQIRKQPIIFDFENLYQGKYYPRRARVYNSPGEGVLCFVEDIPQDTNIISYRDLFSASYNEFLVSPTGMILSCRWPEKTITGNVVGFNVFDTLMPEYIDIVRETMDRVLEKKVELPVEYTFSIAGEVRSKTGTIKPRGYNVLFCVRRIAKAQKTIYNCRCG